MSATGEPGDAGMTLLEVLVVVTVTALIGGLVFPSLQRTIEVLSLRQSAGVLGAELRAARAKAVRTGRPAALTVVAGRPGYDAGDGRQRELPLGQRLELGRDGRMVFFPDGSSTGGAAAVADGGRRIALQVDAATGAVAVAR